MTKTSHNSEIPKEDQQVIAVCTLTRYAEPHEAQSLSNLAMRSKSLHGYPAEYLENCRSALTITEREIKTWPVVVIEEQGKVIGFFALMNLKGENRLEHLWLEPENTKQGVGTTTFKRIVEEARQLGWKSFRIVADPKAKGFYLKMGAKLIGETQSKINPDIFLPYLEYHVNEASNRAVYRNKVLVADHDPNWKKQFEEIKNYIWPHIESHALSIEHVGSTSINGLAAKPIIDIDIVVKDKTQSALVIERLNTLGFEHRGDLGIEGREAFTQLPQFAKHNLYVCIEGCLALRNHLNFRNFLLKNPDAVKKYSELKTALASKTNDMGEYIEGKTEFITSILSRTGISKSAIQSIEKVNRNDS